MIICVEFCFVQSVRVGSVRFGSVTFSSVKSVKLCSGGVGSVELRRLTSVPFCLGRLSRFSFVGFSWVELGRFSRGSVRYDELR